MLDRVTDAPFGGHPNIPARLDANALYGLPTGEALARLQDEAARATAEQGPESATRVQEILELAAAILPIADMAELVATMRAATGAWFAYRAPSRTAARCGYGHQKRRPQSRAERCAYLGDRRRHAKSLPLMRPGREGAEAVAAALAEMPVRARRAAGQLDWLTRVADDAELAFRRPDWRANVLAVVIELARRVRWFGLYADEATDGMEMTARPTWAVLQRATGRSRSTVRRVLRWLRNRGWLAVVETGTTERIRTGLQYPLPDMHAGEGNRAAVYLLTVPTVPLPAALPEQGRNGLGMEVTPLPGSHSDQQIKTTIADTHASAHTRGPAENQTDRTKGSTGRAGFGIHSPVPCGRWSQRDRLRAAEAARDADPVLRTRSARALRSKLTPWWKVGWTTADVIHALNHTPDGQRFPARYDAVSDLYNVSGWIDWRLGHWLTPQGDPMPSISQQAQEKADRKRAAQDAHRAALAELDAPAIVPSQGPTGKAALAEYRAQVSTHRSSAQIQRAAQQRKDAEFRKRLVASDAPACPAASPLPEQPEDRRPADWARELANSARARIAARRGDVDPVHAAALERAREAAAGTSGYRHPAN